MVSSVKNRCRRCNARASRIRTDLTLGGSEQTRRRGDRDFGKTRRTPDTQGRATLRAPTAQSSAREFLGLQERASLGILPLQQLIFQSLDHFRE